MRRQSVELSLILRVPSDGKCSTRRKTNEEKRWWREKTRRRWCACWTWREWKRVECEEGDEEKLRSFIFRLVWHESKEILQGKVYCIQLGEVVGVRPNEVCTFSLQLTSLVPVHRAAIRACYKWWSVGGRRRWMMRILTDLCDRCRQHKFLKEMF